MRFCVDRLDTLILRVSDIELACAWYQRVLGMEREDDERFGGGARTALKFGGQSIALIEDAEYRAEARGGRGGNAGLSFITAVGPQDVVAHLHACGVTIESGPAPGIGALGPLTRVTCRDPDHTLIEIATYLT